MEKFAQVQANVKKVNAFATKEQLVKHALLSQ
jgi:hypothetical protein